MFRGICSLALLITIGIGSVEGADWPSFRGPNGNGIAAEGEKAPVEWGPEKNIRWKVPMPKPGNGSPIVVGGRVFVTSAEDDEGKQRSLYCFDADTGKKLWAKTVAFDRVMPKHSTNTYASTTPVSDGKRVVVWHASAGLHCYDMNGQPLWSRDLGEFRHKWGFGTSPILHKGRVILHTGPGKRVFVTAIDLENGKTVWETDEPLEGENRLPDEQMGAWNTPRAINRDGAERIIVTMPLRVVAYDAETGGIAWTCSGVRHSKGALTYSSAVFVDDICVITGGLRGVSMGIRLGGSGDVTETHRLFRKENNPQNIASAIATGGYVFRANAWGGTLDCIDPKTGEPQWRERGGVGDFWASTVMIDGLLYATS